MTVASEQASDRRTATETVEAFFAAYRDQDVNAMVTLCTPGADFHYVPFEMWGKQRVLRGDGKVRTIGKPMWVGLIGAFPDLTNTVKTITADAHGDVAAEVVIGGTQAGPWGVIAPRGRVFSEPHLFVLHVDEDGLIDSITAYWDNASIYRQLGHLEVD
ncbi:nuclear transport factor 2 family protein [Amycolatopsis rubida]|uniref:Ketosteroid isomerase-related protein n=1 Tax=Amycolatopsis rubida TaxID=112413 RepID=A0A1I5NE75_9PSEU|nr:nuclear transport factor 2 family protein [Amycolatopsis rubida]SFP19696.1 Ketosteroid isomerase-related protein [Amycolatopsis rubida]